MEIHQFFFRVPQFVRPRNLGYDWPFLETADVKSDPWGISASTPRGLYQVLIRVDT